MNYNSYITKQYDSDILKAIPYHKELHEHIINYVKTKFVDSSRIRILDLWVWTWITSKMLQDIFPNATIDVVDFSKQMITWAREKLGTKNVNYIIWDYATLDLTNRYDIVVSVIWIHHQTDKWKMLLFEKIYSLLKNNWVFIFWDLVTYKDDIEASKNHALHYHHMVENAKDMRILWEWAHHHIYLNELAPYEDQIIWLINDWFSVKKDLLKINTGLFICEK